MNEWIDAEERLPKNEDEVLVWYEYFRYGNYNCMWQMYGIGSYLKQYDRWSGDPSQGTKVKVLYWMPLPKPPTNPK